MRAARPQLAQKRPHRGGQFPVRQHANFDGDRRQVLPQRLELRLEKGSGRRVHGRDSHRVLRRQARDGGAAVAAHGGEGVQVGLQAGAAARVGPRNRVDYRFGLLLLEEDAPCFCG